MALRIDRIRLNRGGPLESDFEVEPGHLNLIYGRNETGKTYIVECLIRMLFRTGTRAPVNWDLRAWGIAGRAIVSGLESEPVSFTKSSNKLEDYWEHGTGLPRDLSRLLVVRAGETQLAEAGDGVGRDMLKACLSGEGLLDKIASRISVTLQDAKVQNHMVTGARRGELKAKKECEARLRNLQSLLENVEEGYASGDAYLLRQQKNGLETQIGLLEKARRYYAAQLAEKIQELNGRKRALPTEGDLARLEAAVSACQSNKIEIETKSEELEELASTSEDFRWAREALGVYKEASSGAAGGSPKQVLILPALLFLVGTVTFGVLGIRIPSVTSAVLAGLFFAITYLDMKKALSSAPEKAELEKLKSEYRSRFGSDLTDRATFQAKLDELNKNEILATPLRKEVDKLAGETRTLVSRIAATLETWVGVEVAEKEWRDTIQTIKGKIGELEDEIESIGSQLASVGVPDDEYLDEDPGVEWVSGKHEASEEQLRRVDQALREEEDGLEKLKARVSQETGSESSDWEELITSLRNKREVAAQEYRQLAAEILAKIQVNKVIQEFRQEEDIRIADGLNRKELSETLYALTGHYTSIRLEEHRGLVLVTDEDEDFPLSSVSTGAREQTFLALRMGFASIAMQGETAFIVLDDAFQHSDWKRRESLVTQTLRLVQTGWQVFYFTMDDHIRDLFMGVREKIGDGFRFYELR
jgi:uncharacterized protein YhaN